MFFKVANLKTQSLKNDKKENVQNVEFYSIF